jgi:hypothetical protein
MRDLTLIYCVFPMHIMYGTNIGKCKRAPHASGSIEANIITPLSLILTACLYWAPPVYLY